MKRHAPGCQCCRGMFVGCSHSSPPFVPASCFGEDVEYVTNIRLNVSLIWQCRLVYANCISGVPFAAGDYAEIADYVAEGGRFWVQTEWESPSPGFGFPPTRPVGVDDFVAALGGSMSWVGGGHDEFCESVAGESRLCQAGDAAIGQNVEVKMAMSAEIAGGTSVLLTPTDGLPMVAVEAVGEGFIFMSGDSNIWNGAGSCGYDNCDFFWRLVNWTNAEIL